MRTSPEYRFRGHSRTGQFPSYHEVSSGVAVGTYTKVTVLEMHNRLNMWRVWVNHKPVSPPIRLPESHDGLMPVATSESWDGGTGGICKVVFASRVARP